MIAVGVHSLRQQLTISVCLANEAPFSASSFEGNPQHLTYLKTPAPHGRPVCHTIPEYCSVILSEAKDL